MKRRHTTDEERALFRDFVVGKVALEKTKQKTAAKSGLPLKKANPVLVPGGLDGRTTRKLERGDLAPDAKLDLHGLTEQAAHRALTSFILTAHQRGLRLVLIVTGKGGRKPDPYAPFDLELNGRARGVLKTMVPRWLGEPALARLIADVRAAHRRHGGEGALSVYLRKKAQ